jgi:hypothetical protein
MSTNETAAPRPAPAETIMPPYTLDPNRRSHKWARRLVLWSVVVFCLVYGIAFALFAPFLIVALVVPVGILLLVVIWALPDTRRSPTEALWPMLFAYMMCLIMWPNYIALALPGLPWITMSRITGIPLAVMLLICVSTSPSFREQLAKSLSATPPIWMLMVAFVGIQTLSLAFSKSVFHSIDKYLVDQMSWTCIFFVSAFVFTKDGRVEKMAGLMWAMAIFVGVIAVFEWRHQQVLWAGHIPSFLQINDKAVQRALAGGARFGKYRAQSTFGTCLGLGECMALTLPFVLRFAAGPYSGLVRAAAAISAPFLVVVAVLSGARVGTIGCLIAIALYGGMWALLKWRREPSSLAGPAIAAAYPVAALAGAAAIMFVGRLRTMFWGDGSQKYSDQDRIEQIRMGIPKIISHPWGYGVGQGGETLGFAPAGADSLTIDNYYLDVALEYGVDGFIVYYGLFAVTMYYCAKALLVLKSVAREVEMLLPIFVSLATYFIIKSAFSEENSHPLPFMMLGMAVALLSRVSPLKRPVSEPKMAQSAFAPARLQAQHR